MFEKYLVPVGIAIGTAVLTLCSVAVAKVSNMTKKFDKGVKEMSEITVKDIQAQMVQEAVHRAAEDKVQQYVALAHREVISDARETIRKEVDAAVKEASRDISDRVSTEISDRAAQIDMDDLKRRVRDKAEEKVLSKFDGNLQDILDKFSGNLGQIQKIYGSIADTLGKGVEKDDKNRITFSVGQ